MIQITVGLNTEGPTDIRFMKSIIKRTLDEIALECDKDIEVLDVNEIKVPKETFADMMLAASKKGVEDYSISILCIHADADDKDIEQVMSNKFTPFFDILFQQQDSEYCKVIVPVIPIRMMEAWMLADKDLLKKKINALEVEDSLLGIHKRPETYSDPKAVIENAIRIANAGKTRRRRYAIGIAELYEDIGTSVGLEALRQLSSFKHFEEGVRNAFKQLNYLRN